MDRVSCFFIDGSELVVIEGLVVDLWEGRYLSYGWFLTFLGWNLSVMILKYSQLGILLTNMIIMVASIIVIIIRFYDE